ncbi:MAG: nitrite reductase small subunit NirD [Porticoccaceae bacterium]|nr:nitrite reductase small subunit NirD [Porticoccaceae bacterium]
MSQATTICDQKDLIANSGICAMVDGQQVALFYLPKETPQVYAIGNWDPIGKAHVLSRGMVGDINERLVVASPLYKQHFDLQTGECLEDSEHSVPVYQVEMAADKVLLTV